MLLRTTLSLLACVVAAGCGPPPYDTAADRDATYPVAATTTPIPPAPPAPVPALLLRNTGSVVGFPVIDSVGQPVGTVQAVAAERGSGEVRYLIIASPNFGFGYYISVPATSAQAAGNHVVLNAPAVAWMQAPRYASAQISAMYGAY